MNLLDIILIVLLAVGVLSGMKNGFIKSTVALLGTLLIFILAFALKNPIANIFYTNLPFFDFFGGSEVINILLYEFIAFLIIVAVLSALLGFILKITKIVEKILNMTIIFGAVSKLLGMVVGFVEMYVIVFVLLVLLSQPFIAINPKDSKVGSFMLNHSPVLTNIAKTTTTVVNEVYDLAETFKTNANKNEFDYKSLEVLLKHEAISTESVKTLKEKNKLTFNGLDKLIEKYEVK